MNYKLVLILVLSSLAMIFLVQNVEAVNVRFLFWSIAISRAIVIFFTFIIGFMIGWFLHSYLTYKKRSRPAHNLFELSSRVTAARCVESIVV